MQDLPPSSGYPTIRFKRNIPQRGFSGFTLFSIMAAMSSYGFYKLFKIRQERRELHRERIWSRYFMYPLFLAELDRDIFRREYAEKQREKEIMKDVAGWKMNEKIYNTKKYVPSLVHISS